MMLPDRGWRGAAHNGALIKFFKAKPLSDKKLDLVLLYRGHSRIELSLLSGALESEGIAFLLKRDLGLADWAPSVFFSPATDVKLYVAKSDWVKAEAMALLVLGEEWRPPSDDPEASSR